jgi:hypothetical protein
MADCDTDQLKSLIEDKAAITVHFYGGRHGSRFETKPLVIPPDSLPVTCEEVVWKCCSHLSKCSGKFFEKNAHKVIGPSVSDLFGLFKWSKQGKKSKKEKYSTDNIQQLWVPEGYLFQFTDVAVAPLEFHFRFKVQPASKRIGESPVLVSKLPEGIVADYLFWQVRQTHCTVL